ncbi:Small RNA 2'-O-methyltransferase [Globomyces sp. JEL0801]|nr:Small RNA 2'-O-methyltransferase [Globomyces sp. JEL0801]
MIQMEKNETDQDPNLFETEEETSERQYFDPPLWRQRRNCAADYLKANNVESVIDAGCGEGSLLEILLNDTQYRRLAGLEVNKNVLRRCYDICKPNSLDFQHLRELPVTLELYQGSIKYTDSRLLDYEAITMMEVIEHLHADELERLPQTVFGYYRPKHVIISTPNAEFNVNFPRLNYGTKESKFRHWDHKFEWTRTEFEDWCISVANQFKYTVSFDGVGLYEKSTIAEDIPRIEEDLLTSNLYRRFGKLEFPYFTRDGATSKEIVDLMLAEFPRLIDDPKIFTLNPILSVEAYWDILKIRQLCKKREKLVQVLQSDEAKEYFELLDGQKIRILWSLDDEYWKKHVRFAFDTEEEEKLAEANVVEPKKAGVDGWDKDYSKEPIIEGQW